jgi:putative transposase
MNRFDPNVHHRHSIRLPDYDYSRAGVYAITVVAQGRECLFGEVVNAEVNLSRCGKIVRAAWFNLPKHYPHVELDVFCVMPEHAHGIVIVESGDAMKRQPLSEIVRAFKSFSAKRINILRNTPGVAVWQRNYYEHIILTNDDYLAQSAYIQDNPINWGKDVEDW